MTYVSKGTFYHGHIFYLHGHSFEICFFQIESHTCYCLFIQQTLYTIRISIVPSHTSHQFILHFSHIKSVKKINGQTLIMYFIAIEEKKKSHRR